MLLPLLWQSTRALRALLAGAGEAAPYTLIGHGGGGQVAQLFAATYPNDTAGVVLVDSYDNVAQVRDGVVGKHASPPGTAGAVTPGACRPLPMSIVSPPHHQCLDDVLGRSRQPAETTMVERRINDRDGDPILTYRNVYPICTLYIGYRYRIGGRPIRPFCIPTHHPLCHPTLDTLNIHPPAPCHDACRPSSWTERLM